MPLLSTSTISFTLTVDFFIFYIPNMESIFNVIPHATLDYALIIRRRSWILYQCFKCTLFFDMLMAVTFLSLALYFLDWLEFRAGWLYVI